MFDQQEYEKILKEMNIIEGEENVRNEIIKLHNENRLD